MTMKEMAYKIEELENESAKLDSLQMALGQAIFRGDFDVKNYEWAFVLFGDVTFELKKQLEALKDEPFSTFRKDEKL